MADEKKSAPKAEAPKAEAPKAPAKKAEPDEEAVKQEEFAKFLADR